MPKTKIHWFVILLVLVTLVTISHNTTSTTTPKVAFSGTTAPAPKSTSAAAGSPTPTPATTNTQSTLVVLASSPASVDPDPSAKQCVLAKLSPQRYELINSGYNRSTAIEFEAFRQCFEARKYVIPANLVPVPADKAKLKQQPVSSDVRIVSISNPTTTEKLVLKFVGKAKPNATVLLYLFSEPLVVTTSADANGDWSYSLNDPMEPGKHEAYALVNKGDGTYERSNVFAFVIAKAEAVPANPNGYSLKIERNQATAVDNTLPVKLYVAAVSGLVVLVIAVATFVFLRHRKLDTQPTMTDFGVVSATLPVESTMAEPTVSIPDASTTPVVPDASTRSDLRNSPGITTPSGQPISPTQPSPTDTPSDEDEVKPPWI